MDTLTTLVQKHGILLVLPMIGPLVLTISQASMSQLLVSQMQVTSMVLIWKPHMLINCFEGGSSAGSWKDGVKDRELWPFGTQLKDSPPLAMLSRYLPLLALLLFKPLLDCIQALFLLHIGILILRRQQTATAPCIISVGPGVVSLLVGSARFVMSIDFNSTTCGEVQTYSIHFVFSY